MQKIKKKILFVYPYMMLGGSTTSLLSILNSIDYREYDVDIMFYAKKGDLYGLLPKEVQALPLACRYPDKRQMYMRKIFSIKSLINIAKGRYYGKKIHSDWVRHQFGSYDNVRYCRKPEIEYDIAISFLEYWPLYYVADSVKAKKKIAWIHTDLSTMNLYEEQENKSFSKIDKIVLISEECKSRFLQCFPKWEKKAIVVENFLSKKYIRESAEEKVEFTVENGKINFITVCRIAFESKGLDRALNVIEQLKKDGYSEKFHWYIVGAGEDEKKLLELISEKNLSDCVTHLGAKNNPFPYEKKCDIFFLPSIFEGKPIAVTEAQILGLVPLVTDYSSAREQVKSGQNGFVMENSERGIYEGIRKVLDNPVWLQKLKKGVEEMVIESNGERQWRNLLRDCEVEK